MRKILVPGLKVLALVFSATPAWAVEESGNRSCEIFQTPVARALAYGTLYLKGPGDSYYTGYNLGSTWSVRSNSGPGGYWRAYISGYGGLDNQGTYAYCAN